MTSDRENNVIEDILILVSGIRKHISQTSCEHCKNVVKKVIDSSNVTELEEP